MISIFILAVLSVADGQFGGLPGGGGGNPLGAPTVPPAAPTVPPAAPTVPPVAPTVPSGVPGPSNPSDICAAVNLGPTTVFSADLIKSVCSVANGWLKGVKDAGLAPPQYRMILTEKQRKYWDAVTSCRGVQCICDAWPKCKSGAGDKSRYGQTKRKEIRAMTDVERRRFFYSLNKIKYNKIDGWSKFDILTGYHFSVAFGPAAHFSAAMLPFHREQIKTLEVALRFEHPLALFPYWDSSLDSEMPNPRDTVLWSEELLGNGEGNLTGGPFGTWTGEANPNFPKPLHQGGIFRAAGLAQGAFLMKKEYVDIILDKYVPLGPAMQSLVFCTDPFTDTVHTAVHIYIGGLMFDPQSSPGEPLFYLHHCFVDSLWEKWRIKHLGRNERASDYALPCPYNPFDLPDMQLLPYPIKVEDAYSNVYTDEFYIYQEWPSCENNCWNSTYLVCKKNGRCMSKIRAGGDCTGLDGVSDNPCYKGKCNGGRCDAA